MAHTHLPIYAPGRIPLNTGESKLDALTPWHADWDAMQACATLFEPEKRLRDMSGANTVTRLLQIPSGHVSERFDDVPYLVPFPAADSKVCVLICPGGAYYDVSLDNEGYPTAAFLQAHGVTAFVLKYRVWPYRYPAAALDCRRALCYLRHHATEFGFDPQKVAIMGYSAGGNLAATTVFRMAELPEIPGYTPDEVDAENPAVASLAAIYSELLADPFLMSMQYGDRIFTDKAFSDRTLRDMYLPQYVTAAAPPAFLCCCMDDGVVPPENTLTMATAYRKAGAPFELHMFHEGGHGFGVTQADVPAMYGHPAFCMDGTKEWIRLYLSWLHKTTERGR